MSGRAGYGGGGGVNGEIAEGEDAGDGRPQGGGFEEQPVPLPLKGVAGVDGGVGGVTKRSRGVSSLASRSRATLGLVVFGPGSGGECDGGL